MSEDENGGYASSRYVRSRDRSSIQSPEEKDFARPADEATESEEVAEETWTLESEDPFLSQAQRRTLNITLPWYKRSKFSGDLYAVKWHVRRPIYKAHNAHHFAREIPDYYIDTGSGVVVWPLGLQEVVTNPDTGCAEFTLVVNFQGGPAPKVVFMPKTSVTFHMPWVPVTRIDVPEWLGKEVP